VRLALITPCIVASTSFRHGAVCSNEGTSRARSPSGSGWNRTTAHAFVGRRSIPLSYGPLGVGRESNPVKWRPTGLEPAHTLATTGRSVQLSYGLHVCR
jgi:hypothetical protein